MGLAAEMTALMVLKESCRGESDPTEAQRALSCGSLHPSQQMKRAQPIRAAVPRPTFPPVQLYCDTMQAGTCVSVNEKSVLDCLKK